MMLERKKDVSFSLTTIFEMIIGHSLYAITVHLNCGPLGTQTLKSVHKENKTKSKRLSFLLRFELSTRTLFIL